MSDVKTIREYHYDKSKKQYHLKYSSNNMEDVKKEINTVFKKFKKNNNFDNITLNLEIIYHENGEYLY